MNYCLYLRIQVDWYTVAIRQIAKGAQNCRGKIFKSHNAIRRSPIRKIIKRMEIREEFAQYRILSVLLDFRKPRQKRWN